MQPLAEGLGVVAMHIVRRVFVVPLANGDRGKTSIVKALVAQGEGRALEKNRKCVRSLISPGGRTIDAYVFGRSFQETEKSRHKSVLKALNHNDPYWQGRELIIMPSHVYAPSDCGQMIEAAHRAGFDAISASVILGNEDPKTLGDYSSVWQLPWDERWTVPNPETTGWKGQADALGRDLWGLICKTMLP